jgi:hypothetical protein
MTTSRLDGLKYASRARRHRCAKDNRITGLRQEVEQQFAGGEIPADIRNVVGLAIQSSERSRR